MKDRAVVLLGASVLGVGASSAVGESFFLGGEVVLGLVLLVLGVALPQYALYRSDGDPTRLGLAALIVAASVLIVGWGALHAHYTGGQFTLPLLWVISTLVVGVFLGALVRELLRGYRSAA